MSILEMVRQCGMFYFSHCSMGMATTTRIELSAAILVYKSQ